MTDYERIKLIVLDVDGTLTDGGIYYDAQGNEMKRFDVKDGLGIKVGMAAGLEFAVITGRESPMVERRVRELGIQHLRTGVQIKLPVLKQLMLELRLSPDEVCYMGDDLNDLACMEYVGIAACPADAAEEVKAVSRFVADQCGGHGAVRSCLEGILRHRDQWESCARRVYCLG